MSEINYNALVLNENEELREELAHLRMKNDLLRDALEQTQRAHQRAQKALRKIDERIPPYQHYRGCFCPECEWVDELKSIAKKGAE